MKQKRKNLILLIITAIILCNTICYATIDPSEFKPKDLTTSDYEKAFQVTGNILNIIQTIGIIVAIGGIMIIGIKYMVGSVEQKAEYKKTMIPYIIGCVLIFGITNLVSIIYKMIEQM